MHNQINNIKQEATLSKDVGRSSKIQSIINSVKSQINNYQKNNNSIKVTRSSGYNNVEVKLGNLKINFRDIPSKSGNSAEYFDDVKSIIVYNCNIENKPKLKVQFNDEHLYHELAHYFDFQGIKNPQAANYAAEKAGEEKNYSNYINSGTEFNAHFFHLVMPIVMAYIEDLNELPNNFNSFKNNILNIKQINQFFNYLNPNNQKRFLKRLGSYWISIKNNEIYTHDGADSSKVKTVTKSWMEKIKSALNLNESKIFISNNTSMKIKDLKVVIKKVVNESVKPNTTKKPIVESKKTIVVKKSKPKSKKEKMCERDEVGQFHIVQMPHKDSKLEEILSTSTLREFVNSGIDMSKVVGTFKNENAARKLAEELLNHRTDTLQNIKEEEIQKKLGEIQTTKALIGATNEYLKLKPSLNEDESNKKLEELNGNLGDLEGQLAKLKEEKEALEETRPGFKPKKKAKKKDDKK